MDSGSTSMGLVLTGGTIDSSERRGLLVIDLSKTAVDNCVQVFVKGWPGPERLDLHTRTPMQKLSESMTPNDWVKIASATRELVEDVGAKSVVVLHGTDTAGYTAAALSFLLADLDATIVLTGSNLSLTDENSDARTNVRDAITVSRSLPSGVYFSFAGIPGQRSSVHLGTTVRKVKPEGQGYVSPNHGIIAQVIDGEIVLERNLPVTSKQPSIQNFSTEVVCIPVHPGADFKMMADALIATKKRGVVVKLFSAATAPESRERDSLQHFVERCTDNKIIVVTCVDQYMSARPVCPSGLAARNAGALFAADIIPETAYVKLCWALAQEQSVEGVRKLFMTPVAGESVVLDSTTSARYS